MNKFRPTIRLRLTLLYGSMFLLAGLILLTVNYTLVRQSIESNEEPPRSLFLEELGLLLPNNRTAGEFRPFPFNAPITEDGQSFQDIIVDVSQQARNETLDQLLLQSIFALAVTSIVAIGLGWLVAGRVLRPVQKITNTARHASQINLHERVNLNGPPDELKELADTFDSMLTRLEAAFESQRRFAAQASHELRTPISIIRAEADVALAESDVTGREVHLAETVRAAADRSEQIIDSLLTLARSESTLHDVEMVDLATLTGDIVGELSPLADTRDLDIDLKLSEAMVVGDSVLLERLVTNLVINAIVHNQIPTEKTGWIQVEVTASEKQAILSIANSGPVIASDHVDTLFDPFFQLNGSRSVPRSGSGLGLTIARSVAITHRGAIDVKPIDDGGLNVIVTLPLRD